MKVSRAKKKYLAAIKKDIERIVKMQSHKLKKVDDLKYLGDTEE